MIAIALLSGGLDSSLAVKLIMDQGIEVVALKFSSPFCQCDSGGTCHAAGFAEKLGIRYISVPKGDEYLDIVREPKFGRGSGMNPCIDCRIFMLKRAKQIADEMGAAFMFTGEVLGQRPMSQHRDALSLIEKEAGLEGKLLRPLSAKLLPETEAERNGWVDRSKLLSISGRGRKPQIQLAAEKGIVDYPCPAGGCLLTSKEFAMKLEDHLAHGPNKLTSRDISILKTGRHFRVNGTKVIIGRNEKENTMLRSLAKNDFHILETTTVPGPIGLVGSNDHEVIDIASSMVVRYSDNMGRKVEIKVTDTDGATSTLMVSPAAVGLIDRYRIGIGDDPIRLTAIT